VSSGCGKISRYNLVSIGKISLSNRVVNQCH
jgi:hypothetical protein